MAEQHHVIIGNGVAGNRAAAVLREPGRKREVWADLLLLKERMRG